jgi:hypothetical protein
MANKGKVWRSLSFFGDLWRGIARLTEIAIDGRSLPEMDKDGRRSPKMAKVFDGKMCDVGLHHRPRAAFTLHPLLAFGSTETRLCELARHGPHEASRLRFCAFERRELQEGFLTMPALFFTFTAHRNAVYLL